ncbi:MULTISPECIES: TadA family conjugal transfer-associated ATPase [unclassified Gordonia (in: high G+C Gram-positive bacteria)]|uniref:TadA family conjugal transfer-associated ATPase n=1 Tax=unclassified Gordonia (in: high G+C Gram-positive bacteria) TaxID=2657482 RepID=UPI001FFF3CD0|nr:MULTISPECIES: TadA family conjugal transfer-associated ATPase [unclassified Gordonia (in: high G+C Gram-positive bacteria)]UQE75383.1 TadA family conjugal transfer-associated ATPase [Gordonia sp. PP30]
MTATRQRHADLLARVRERLAAHAAEPDAETIADAVRAESGGLLSDTDLLAALRYLQTELVGAGPLETLLADPAVTDILVTAPDRVWVERGRGLEPAAVAFDDEAGVRRLAVRLALGAGRRLDDAQPWVDGRLSGVGRHGYAVRLHAMIPPLAVDGTCISLRVLRSVTKDFAAMTGDGSIPRQARDLLLSVVARRRSFLVIGGTGAGKTTLLNALLGQVDPGERMILVEDAPELDPQHPHVVRLVARAPNVEGIGEVSVRALVRQALRMRPDRIVVGEVRGAEVIDLLTALNTGHEGCAGTLHANSIAEVPARMEALAALGGIGRSALQSQLAAALDVVIGVERRPGGDRRLVEIGAVERAGGGEVSIRPLWTRGDR